MSPSFREDNDFTIGGSRRPYYHPVPEYKRVSDPYILALKLGVDDNPLSEFLLENPLFIQIGEVAHKVWLQRQKRNVLKGFEAKVPKEEHPYRIENSKKKT